ncbi:divalent-cation tolerance protein CutA, partial [Escherichia coli]|uniref:divalent-cation tolerance protein CutA n=1 Tax=Escherichia coli TaxID=562 RepID=UPI0028DE7D76
TWPDAETAEALAREALEQGLCACANLFPPIRSIYRWKDAVEEAVETPMTLKTTRAAEGALRGLIVARHPYDVPCILALTVDSHAS